MYRPSKYDLSGLKEGVYTKDPFENNFKKILDISVKVLISIFINKDKLIYVLKNIKENINKSKEEKGVFYDKFIDQLLRAVVNDISAGERYWRDYKFFVPNDNNQIIQIEGDDKMKAKFFYEILIEYVEKELFI